MSNAANEQTNRSCGRIARGAAGLRALLWSLLIILVFINPCVLYCAVAQHALHNAMQAQPEFAQFICQLPAGSAATRHSPLAMHQTEGDSRPAHRSLPGVYEYLPNALLMIGLFAGVLTFLTPRQQNFFASLATCPPTPPPRFMF